MLDIAGPGIESIVDDRQEVDVLALSVGDVCRQDDARAARPNSLAQRARPEAGEDDAVDCPDADRREHRDDGLDGRRHVDREAVALADPEAAKAGRDPLDLGEQLGVGAGSSPTTLVEPDQRRGVAATGSDVSIERVDREVGPAAREPGEARLPAKLEGSFRSPRPVEALGGLEPERLWVVERALVQVVVAPAGRVGRDVRHRNRSIDPTMHGSPAHPSRGATTPCRGQATRRLYRMRRGWSAAVPSSL